jgi:hypothetical protein
MSMPGGVDGADLDAQLDKLYEESGAENNGRGRAGLATALPGTTPGARPGPSGD